LQPRQRPAARGLLQHRPPSRPAPLPGSQASRRRPLWSW
jgi:hypothetical protein